MALLVGYTVNAGSIHTDEVSEGTTADSPNEVSLYVATEDTVSDVGSRSTWTLFKLPSLSSPPAAPSDSSPPAPTL